LRGLDIFKKIAKNRCFSDIQGGKNDILKGIMKGSLNRKGVPILNGMAQFTLVTQLLAKTVTCDLLKLYNVNQAHNSLTTTWADFQGG
jgi:hypothetical protein